MNESKSTLLGNSLGDVICSALNTENGYNARNVARCTNSVAKGIVVGNTGTMTPLSQTTTRVAEK